MDFIIDAVVAAVNNVVYNLATRLFKPETPKRLALVPASNARGQFNSLNQSWVADHRGDLFEIERETSLAVVYPNLDSCVAERS